MVHVWLFYLLSFPDRDWVVVSLGIQYGTVGNYKFPGLFAQP